MGTQGGYTNVWEGRITCGARDGAPLYFSLNVVIFVVNETVDYVCPHFSHVFARSRRFYSPVSFIKVKVCRCKFPHHKIHSKPSIYDLLVLIQ